LEETAQMNAELLLRRHASRSSKFHFRIENGEFGQNPNALGPRFRVIQPMFDAAERLKKDGLSPRNVIEHSDLNFAAAKRGMPRSGFLRKSNLLPELPSDALASRQDASRAPFRARCGDAVLKEVARELRGPREYASGAAKS
jgi:hypothetical protein